MVESLLAQGVTTAFGVPGESYLDVLDALVDAPQIRMIPNRNEGGAAFMAAAWGQLTGQPGIAFVTRGPGATNAAIGVHTARQNSAPMILFVGQIDADMRDREAFQEVDYRAFFGPIAKWATQIDSVGRIPEIIARAFSVALSGRPGPVVVALPEDVLAATSLVPPRPPVIISQAAPAESGLTALEMMMAQASRPLVIVGGGGWTHSGKTAFRTFVEANRLPVINAFRFHDLLDNNSPSYCGDGGLGKFANVARLIDQADLLFGFNIRWGEITTDGFLHPNPAAEHVTIVHSHASDAELGKVYRTDLPLHAGPNELALSLAGRRMGDWSAWSEPARTAFLAGRRPPPQPGALDMGQVIAHLQRVLPDDAILTNGAGNFATWHSKYFLFGLGNRLLAPQSGAMGYGLPAAVAAKLADPARCVVCIAGDGDFQMTCQELGTAQQAGACPIVLIVNNGSYGTIRMHQERHFPGRVSFTDLGNPDFVMLARSYGFHAEKVTATADFAAAFGRAMQSTTGSVLELVIDVEQLTPRQTLSQIRAAALKGPD